METSVCLSQSFVNKQNVRSFSNIIKSKLLKNEDNSPFIQHVLEDEPLVSALSPEFLILLSVLKSNLRDLSKEDFRNYFLTIKGKDVLNPLNKDDIFGCCWTALNAIVPKEFYGGNPNQKVLKKFVHTVVNSMRKQHFVVSKLLQKWDFSKPIWKNPQDSSMKILCKTVLWLVKYVLSAMIALNFYVTTCKLDADENKLHFFWKSKWQAFYDRKISDMVFTRVLKRSTTFCLSRQARKHHTDSEKGKLKSLRKDIPKLHLVLKPNNDCRPIVRYKNEQQTSAEKYKIKDRLNFLKTITNKSPKNIELQFNSIYQNWVELNRPKLYFIKTDLSNAFGLINKEKLMKILAEKHLEFQTTSKNMGLKKKIAQQYKDMVTELRKPLLVRAGNTVYEWVDGLVQGYKYSPALSELYYGYLDSQYFSEHFKNSKSQIQLFIRVVDDYLYVTDSLDDATSFLESLSRYRNVNYDKTVVNFEHEHIRSSEEITFLGYSYNTRLLHVSRASNVFVGEMCYKIAFTSSLANLTKFLENRIGQSGIQINGHIFNLNHNTEEVLWKHVFTTFCLSANKFCTTLAVAELSSQTSKTEVLSYISLYKKKVTVKLSNTMIDTLLKNKPADYLFVYCINHFRYLSFKALCLCAKQTSKCGVLVPIVNDELAKSNCIFGKWRDHACRVESNGEMRREAIRQVCRRTDLRAMFKSFDVLPTGFQCYKEKKM